MPARPCIHLCGSWTTEKTRLSESHLRHELIRAARNAQRPGTSARTIIIQPFGTDPGACYRSLMPQKSAGLLMYRVSDSVLEVFLVHPGGPFWAAKDEGSWSIPKGLVTEGEDKLEAAKREFAEETSILPSGPWIYLGEIRQKSGKNVYGWAFEGNCDLAQVKSNTFTLEWPPKSGRIKEFPEIDKGEFFPLPDALRKINRNQAEFLKRLEKHLGSE